MDMPIHKRGRRALRRSVVVMPPAEVFAELEMRKASTDGDMGELRARLFSLLEQEEEERERLAAQAGGRPAPRYTTALVEPVPASKIARKRGRKPAATAIQQPAGRESPEREAIRETLQMSREEARAREYDENRIENASDLGEDEHPDDAPEEEVPEYRGGGVLERCVKGETNAAPTSTSDSIAASQTGNHLVRTTSSDGAQLLNIGHGGLVFSRSGVPQMAIAPELSNFLQSHPDQFEYFAAQVIRAGTTTVSSQSRPIMTSTSSMGGAPTRNHITFTPATQTTPVTSRAPAASASTPYVANQTAWHTPTGNLGASRAWGSNQEQTSTGETSEGSAGDFNETEQDRQYLSDRRASDRAARDYARRSRELDNREQRIRELEIRENLLAAREQELNRREAERRAREQPPREADRITTTNVRHSVPAPVARDTRRDSIELPPLLPTGVRSRDSLPPRIVSPRESLASLPGSVSRRAPGEQEPRRESTRRRTHHTSGEESESEREERRERRTRRATRSERDRGDAVIQVKIVKSLHDWGLKFTGSDKNEDPEEFLERLGDCKEGLPATDAEFLKALPCRFSKEAGRWYRTAKDKCRNWREFKISFRNQFIGEYDVQDLRFRATNPGARREDCPLFSQFALHSQ